MSTLFSELYQNIADSTFELAKEIKLFICDVDGVFSDGRIYLGNNQEEFKAFHTRDGYGVKALINSGVPVAIITGRQSTIVEQRMTSLNIADIHQGQENKTTALETCLHYPLSLPQIDRVIVGVDNNAQLKQIIEAFNPRNRPFIFPDIFCDDELLLNPSNWPIS